MIWQMDESTLETEVNSVNSKVSCPVCIQVWIYLRVCYTAGRGREPQLDQKGIKRERHQEKNSLVLRLMHARAFLPNDAYAANKVCGIIIYHA